MIAELEQPKPEVYRCRLRGELETVAKELEAMKGSSADPEVKEILVEGPRGTGKSRGSLTHMVWNWMCWAPGSKWLVVRKTRESLTKTFCQTFEREVIPPDYRPAVVGDALPESRSAYRHPNGSWLGLVGLDRPSRHQGSNVDGVILEEASELTWNQVQPFFGAIRQFTPKMPFQLMLALTNPGPPTHWLNQRAARGEMRRVRTKHVDNPKWYDDKGNVSPQGKAFLASLEKYTGVEYKRQVLGLWVGAEGLVWENFDPALHVIEAPRRPDNTLDWGRMGLKDYIGGMDWGFTAPGSLSIYGRDSDKRLVRVAQIYRTKQQLEWWADRVEELDREFSLTRIMCDPSRPDAIALVNDHLAKRGLPRLCEGADNTKATSVKGDLAGLDLVRWGLQQDETGMPRIRFVRDGLRFGPDLDLVEQNKPLDTIQEIPAYTFARDSAGEIMDDRTDPDAADHGCDELRYVCAENWKRSPPVTLVVPKFKRGTMGQVLDHRSEYNVKRRVRV